MKFLDKVNALFDYVTYYVWSEGGDGWALIVSNDYCGLAKLFQEYDKNNGNYYLLKNESENYISFSENDHSEEHVAFTSIMPNESDRRFYELIIKADNILLRYKKEYYGYRL